eukprot:TRINITY_DN3812_c0_g1_i2.p1 TRINITY_DN3812_c0_g1~~TRINITY_DN3812_c0_g1_i2.p1  ORF type:complete len:219 (+),score=56.89 TRINITY_DN3812_c0_g1_i2:320-976(+)
MNPNKRECKPCQNPYTCHTKKLLKPDAWKRLHGPQLKIINKVRQEEMANSTQVKLTEEAYQLKQANRSRILAELDDIRPNLLMPKLIEPLLTEGTDDLKSEQLRKECSWKQMKADAEKSPLELGIRVLQIEMGEVSIFHPSVHHLLTIKAKVHPLNHLTFHLRNPMVRNAIVSQRSRTRTRRVEIEIDMKTEMNDLRRRTRARIIEIEIKMTMETNDL